MYGGAVLASSEVRSSTDSAQIDSVAPMKANAKVCDLLATAPCRGGTH